MYCPWFAVAEVAVALCVALLSDLGLVVLSGQELMQFEVLGRSETVFSRHHSGRHVIAAVNTFLNFHIVCKLVLFSVRVQCQGPMQASSAWDKHAWLVHLWLSLTSCSRSLAVTSELL